MIDGGFPIYILDDDSIFFVKRDMSHSKFWEKIVAKIVAKKYSISTCDIINLPYSQRRARVVNNKLYCGEKLSKKLLEKIQKEIGIKVSCVYDEHETRCKISVSEFNSLKPHVY
jgi:hypothetical protein